MRGEGLQENRRPRQHQAVYLSAGNHWSRHHHRCHFRRHTPRQPRDSTDHRRRQPLCNRHRIEHSPPPRRTLHRVGRLRHHLRSVRSDNPPHIRQSGCHSYRSFRPRQPGHCHRYFEDIDSSMHHHCRDCHRRIPPHAPPRPRHHHMTVCNLLCRYYTTPLSNIPRPPLSYCYQGRDARCHNILLTSVTACVVIDIVSVIAFFPTSSSSSPSPHDRVQSFRHKRANESHCHRHLDGVPTNIFATALLHSSLLMSLPSSHSSPEAPVVQNHRHTWAGAIYRSHRYQLHRHRTPHPDLSVTANARGA